MKASDCPTFCPWSQTSKRSSELCLVMSLKIVNGIVKLSLCKNSIIKCQKHYCSHFESVLPPTNSPSPGTCLMSLAWFINLQTQENKESNIPIIVSPQELHTALNICLAGLLKHHYEFLKMAGNSVVFVPNWVALTTLTSICLALEWLPVKTVK